VRVLFVHVLNLIKTSISSSPELWGSFWSDSDATVSELSKTLSICLHYDNNITWSLRNARFR
jgi:hypothetical protein